MSYGLKQTPDDLTPWIAQRDLSIRRRSGFEPGKTWSRVSSVDGRLDAVVGGRRRPADSM
jgi:hypothetical protein